MKKYEVTFNSKGNSKKIPLKTTGKIVSGKVTLEKKELNGLAKVSVKDLVIEEKNSTYICKTNDKEKVVCSKK